MIKAQFNFRVALKDDVEPKQRNHTDNAKLKKVIQNEFFKYFELDVECEPTLKVRMTQNEDGIQANATLTGCDSVSDIKKAVQEFVKVFGGRFTLETNSFYVYDISVKFIDCKQGYSKYGTKCLKDCKVGTTRNSKTMRCRKNI